MGMCLSSCPFRFEQLGGMWILEMSWFAILTERGVFAFWYKTLQEVMHFLSARWQRRETADSLSCRAVGEGPTTVAGRRTCPHPHLESAAAASHRQRRFLAGSLARLPWATATAIKASAAIFTSCCWLYDWLENFWQNNVSTKETVLLKLTHFKQRMTELIHLDFSHLKNEAFHFNLLPWKQFVSTFITLIYCAFKYLNELLYSHNIDT